MICRKKHLKTLDKAQPVLCSQIPQNAWAPLQCSLDCTAATDTKYSGSHFGSKSQFCSQSKPTYTPDHTQLTQLLHEIKAPPNILHISTTLPLLSAVMSPAYWCVYYWLGWFPRVVNKTSGYYSSGTFYRLYAFLTTNNARTLAVCTCLY